MTIYSSTDLRDLIATLSQETPDPATVTRKILADLDDSTARTIAQVTLHAYVREHMVNRFELPKSAEPVLYETPSGQAPSSYVASLRSWVEVELGRSVCVDAKTRRYKRLADCTAPDLMAAAQSRMDSARRLQLRANRFAKLALELEKDDVATVKELPEDILAKYLGAK